MAKPSIWHDRNFDRDAEYVVSRAFLLSGVEQCPGQPFDKTKVSVRLHRQLYEQRKIKFADGERAPAPPGKPLNRVRAARPMSQDEFLKHTGIRHQDRIVRDCEEDGFGGSRIVATSIERQETQLPRVKHVGHGKFAVFRVDERISELMSKAEAEASLKELLSCR